MDLSFSLQFPYSMVDCILDQWLKDHTRHHRAGHTLINLLCIMDLSCKSYIQNVNITVNQFQFFLKRGIFFHLPYIIAEEICHVLYKQTGIFCTLHHGKLCCCIQTVKQKMRVDLRLQIFKLCFLKVIFHTQFILDQPAFPLIVLFCLPDIITDTVHHFVAGFRHRTDLISGINDRKIYLQSTFGDRICRLRKFDKRSCNRSGHHNDPYKCYKHGYGQKKHTESDNVIQCGSQNRIILRVFKKHRCIQASDTGLQIIIKLLRLTVFFVITAYISSPLCLDRTGCLFQICIRHIADIFFHQKILVVYRLFIQFTDQISVILLI